MDGGGERRGGGEAEVTAQLLFYATHMHVAAEFDGLNIARLRPAGISL